ncbi:MAG: mechanosensitive ion channel family protein [Acidimicrobiia bacterium]|nr:mechanosensitive ion channel family protein [Acidimicrobiia bacterium]
MDVCNAGQDFICDWIWDITGNERVAEVVDWVVERPLKVAVILLIAYVINRVVHRGIRRAEARMVRDRDRKLYEREVAEVADGRFAELQHKALVKAQGLAQAADRSKQRARTLTTVLDSVATLTIFGLAILISLGELDITLGPLIAGAGIAGIAIGFGAQSIVRDFLAGVFMLIEDQYGVGDIVDLGDATGTVEEISLRTTRIRDVHGTVWYIPNGEVRRVANMSYSWARSVLDIAVAYDTDIDLATRVIKEAANSVWREGADHTTILEEPEVWGVEELGDSAVVIRLVVKTEPGEQWMTSREIRRRVKQAFDREGIVIPFPQRVVWTEAQQAADQGQR